MANSISYRGSISSGRTKLLDITYPDQTIINISALVLSCGGADPEWEVYFDKNVNDLAIPAVPTLTLATTGGSILRNTKTYIRITTVDANGIEGSPSEGLKTATTGSGTDTNKITVSWSSVTGASSYNVYASTAPGMEAFVGNTASTSLIVTTLPANAVQGISTAPDIRVIGKKGGVEPIPLAGSGLSVSNRLIVYVTVTAGADPAFSILSI